MEIPETLVRELTGFTELAIDLPQPERRRHPRFPYGKQAILWPHGNGPGRGVFVRDISISGLSLIDNHAMKSGERFQAILPRTSGKPVTIDCAAQRCGEGATAGQFLIGAIFRQIIDPPELAAGQRIDVDDDLITKAIVG